MSGIRVYLSEAEAEALLAHDARGKRLHDFDPTSLFHARAKLIDHLLRDPDYRPPAHRAKMDAAVYELIGELGSA